MRFPEARLIVFAKAPLPGAVMTRLHHTLGPEGAARLHRTLVRRTLTVACGAGLCPVQLWCTPTVDHPFFARCAREFGVERHLQVGDGLGERMGHALGGVLRRAPYAAILGCDCPSLSTEDLGQALGHLADGSDAVMAPAQDGGYVLLGLRRAAHGLFADIPWGSGRVAAVTRRRMSELRWQWRELPLQWDVDRPEDLERLAATGLWAPNEGPPGQGDGQP